MRPSYLPGILIGVALIYIGLFGLSGLGMGLQSFSLTGKYATQDFTTFLKVDPNKALTVSATTLTETNILCNSATYVYKSFTSAFSGDFEMQVQAQLNSIVAQGGESNMFVILVLSNTLGGSAQMNPQATPGLAIYDNPPASPVFSFGDARNANAQHTAPLNNGVYSMYYYDWKRVGGTSTVTIYSDPSYTTPLATLTMQDSQSYNYLMVCQTDNKPIGGQNTVTATESNLIIAGLGAGTDTGSLTVTAQVNGAYVNAPITLTGPTTVTGTTSGSTGYTFSSLTTGTYTISTTYAGIQGISPQSVTVAAGSNPICLVTLSTTSNQNNGTNNSTNPGLIWLQDHYQTISLYMGVAVAGICGMMFIMPAPGSGRRYYPPPQPQYYG